jgi:hypothetical protein
VFPGVFIGGRHCFSGVLINFRGAGPALYAALYEDYISHTKVKICRIKKNSAAGGALPMGHISIIRGGCSVHGEWCKRTFGITMGLFYADLEPIMAHKCSNRQRIFFIAAITV